MVVRTDVCTRRLRLDKKDALMHKISSRFTILLFVLLAPIAGAAESRGSAVSPRVANDKPDTPPVTVAFDTSEGAFEVELYPDKAPATVKNFLDYVKSGFYSGVIFHRVVPGFVVQTGGFDRQYQRRETQAPIANESANGLRNLRGTLSMARTSMPDSATSQFFISLVDNKSLDWKPGSPGYAVFGKVIRGMDVIDRMAQLPQGEHKGLFANAPNKPVVIESATINQTKDSKTK